MSVSGVHTVQCALVISLPLSPQIDRQLQTYLQRVEAVLGAGWENHVEGQRLKQDGDSFRQKLNTQPLFDEWRKKVTQLNPPLALTHNCTHTALYCAIEWLCLLEQFCTNSQRHYHIKVDVETIA